MSIVTSPRNLTPPAGLPRAAFVLPDGRGKVDLPTAAGMAALVYVLSAVLHEAGGHGLACLAVGAPPREWGAYSFDCHFGGLSFWAARFVAAAGSTANVLVAALALGLASLVRERGPATRLFVWLLFTVNAFQWAGYFLYSGLTGFGDWGTDGVLAGIIHAPHARVVMVAVGAYLYYWWINVRSGRMLGAILGGTSNARRTGQYVSMTAYAVGGTVALLAALLSPLGAPIFVGSALASSLGGTFGLLFVSLQMPRDGRGAGASLVRRWPWVLLGAATALTFAAVLGPTIVFRP